MDYTIAERSRQYSRRKYFLNIAGILYLLVILFVFLQLGWSYKLAAFLKERLPAFLVLATYILVLSAAYYLLDLPFNFYRSFVLEHKFHLTNQKIPAWLSEQAKAGVLSYIFSVILFLGFYLLVKHTGIYWWVWVSLGWLFFSLVLARILPVVIIPLFFKYKPLTNTKLKERILKLADKMRVRVVDIFQIDFSKKTLKANAAFVGLGSAKRVLLADTLESKYTDDEIEVILAHEFAHYKLKHLLKLIFINSITTVLIFYLMFVTSSHVLKLFSLGDLSDISSLAVVLLYFVIFGIIMQPFENYLSRRFERQADIAAVGVTGLKDAFISTMNKLSDQNLADRKPHPVIKFFFFDHPPIDERIELVSRL